MYASDTLRSELFSQQPSDPIQNLAAAPPVVLPGLAATSIQRGLQLLLQARRYALDRDVSAWQFAVSHFEMRLYGLTICDVRWLVLKGWVEHGLETTVPGDAERSFRGVDGTQFSKRSVFILTPAGVVGAERIERSVADLSAETDRLDDSVVGAPAVVSSLDAAPRWDADLQELRFGDLLVKRFKVPAPNQELVLAAFQEENWPRRIDDPLPPQADQDPKRRLHDTIVSLNRTLRRPLIRFAGDGSGQGVRWTPTTDVG